VSVPNESENTGVHDLVCAECGKRSTEEAAGWRAFRTDLEDDPAGLAFYRPRCAERECGDR
jgi:hypothetical protein